MYVFVKRTFFKIKMDILNTLGFEVDGFFKRSYETMTLDQKQVRTREELKKVRAQEKQIETMRDRRKKIRVRLIPVWVKVAIVIFLTIASMLVGTVVGYGVIGNGKPSEALQKGTWTHIMDIINKK
ncbi:DNA-directed RNA polymerase subunit beta [Pseudoneobacillus rhizosphaerae]|nr:DNA-directed RNA polymerase subunit beta [Pseudoneobacillus rhizosphaerae]